MSPSKKPINPRRNVSARKVPRKRGLRQRDLNRLQALQARDLGAKKSKQRLWELRDKYKFAELVDSFPEEFRRIGYSLIDSLKVYNALKELFAVEKSIGKKKVDEIIEFVLFRCPDEFVPDHIVEGLGDFKFPRSVRLLEKALSHHLVMVRYHAAISLGRLKSVHSVRFLERALYDPNIIVRASAATALGELHSVRSVPLLEKLLKSTSDEWLCSHYRGALEEIAVNRRRAK